MKAASANARQAEDRRTQAGPRRAVRALVVLKRALPERGEGDQLKLPGSWPGLCCKRKGLFFPDHPLDVSQTWKLAVFLREGKAHLI